MAAERRGQAPMTVSLPNGPSQFPATDLPPISALFLIYFDLKAGYTISWKQSLPGIELEGVVEYKSLPSGLHTVEEDLIYFVHGQYAGLSAFVNAPDGAEQRNAKMIAVGVLVPLSFGRLGRSWKHAEGLKTLAQQLVKDSKDFKVLEEYWESHGSKEATSAPDDGSPVESSSSIQFIAAQKRGKKSHTRNRSASDGAALLPPGHQLSPHHPAWSLSRLLSSFGPLIFPIYRAALLRKRILISCHAPVEEICNFVYDLSVISNIPLAVTSLLQSSSPPHRLRPLFTIGVHDIPLLEDDLKASAATSSTPSSEDIDLSGESGSGCIACTTDGILGMKTKLYDVLITMPLLDTPTPNSPWPTITTSDKQPIQATQRDLRRYKALKWSLDRAFTPSNPPSPTLTRRDTTSSISSLLNRPTSSSNYNATNPALSIPDTDAIVEPLSWSALAYTGFMWWASAGERQISMDDEFSSDTSLIDDISSTSHPTTPKTPKSRTGSRDFASQVMGVPVGVSGLDAEGGENAARKEMAIIAYFHRLTTLILTTLSDLVDTADSDDELTEAPYRDRDDDGEEEEEDPDINGPAVYVSSADMAKMGLDSWSEKDHAFVEDMCRAYFGRRAVVEGNAVDVCGIRIC